MLVYLTSSHPLLAFPPIHDVLYSRIVELEDQSFEVLWLKIMPKKLPTAFSCIILACIYHPPGANSAVMRDHVINGVYSVVRKNPNCGVLLTGDFNQLNDTFLKTHYRYAQIVKVLTCEPVSGIEVFLGNNKTKN